MKEHHVNINIIVAFNEKDYNSYIEGVQDAPLDARTIEIVARHLTNWEQLAHYLQLTDAETEEIKHDYAKYMQQKYECIRIWASKNGKDGTIINLLWHIYFDLNDKSLVMKIVDNLKDKGICINTTYHTTKNIGRSKILAKFNSALWIIQRRNLSE